MNAKKTDNVEQFPAGDRKHSERKWGKAVMSHGYCLLPSILLQAQARLAVSAQEMMVLLQLVEHWWTPESKVYPSKETLGERIGLSEKQVQRHIRRLEEAKLVKRIERFAPDGGRTSNEYDLSGLVARLKQIEPDFAAAKQAKAAAKKPGGPVATALKNKK